MLKGPRQAASAFFKTDFVTVQEKLKQHLLDTGKVDEQTANGIMGNVYKPNTGWEDDSRAYGDLEYRIMWEWIRDAARKLPNPIELASFAD